MKIKLTDIPLEKSRSSHLEGKADKYGDFLASCFNPTKEARENRAPNATVSAQHFLLVHRHHAFGGVSSYFLCDAGIKDTVFSKVNQALNLSLL